MSRAGVMARPIAPADTAVVAKMADISLLRQIACEIVVLRRDHFADHDRVGAAVFYQAHRNSGAEAIEAAAHIGGVGGLSQIAASLNAGRRLRRAGYVAVSELIWLVAAETPNALWTH